MAEVLISCEGENVCQSLSPVFLFVFVLVSATPLNGLLYLGHKCISIVYVCILHAPTIIGHVHICKKFFDFMIFGSYARFEIYVYHRRAIWERGECELAHFFFH